MNDLNFEVYPLFSSPVAVVQVKENLSRLKDTCSDYVFRITNAAGSHNTYMTENLNILDKFSKEKQILFDYFTAYKDEALKLKTTNFKITTSWLTKTASQGFSQFHNHCNSAYSAIFYFDEIEGGDLEFESYGILPWSVDFNEPSEWGILNSHSWKFSPKKNMLIIFPSYLHHRVTLNNSTQPRYSLAFNIFPNGAFGNGDSSMNITIN